MLISTRAKCSDTFSHLFLKRHAEKQLIRFQRMSDGLMKTPIMHQAIKLPEDIPLGTRIPLRIECMHNLHWKGHWTMMSTAQGQFEIKLDEFSLTPWEFLALVEIQLIGENKVSETIQKEVRFSPKFLELKLDPVENARRYNTLELRITRQRASGVQLVTYVDFEKKSRWLDVLIESEKMDIKLYANSSILALHSPVLRQQFEMNEGSENVIKIPSTHFRALQHILDFLNPPCVINKVKLVREIGRVMDLALEWKMEVVRNKCENVLCEERKISKEGLHFSLEMAEKYQFRKLLEEVLFDVDKNEIFALLREFKYSEWVRGAMFSCFLTEVDENWMDDDELDAEDF